MLDETSYTLYNKYLTQLFVKLRYNAVVNLYGNGYAGEMANKAIEEANPFNNLNPQNEKDNKKKNKNSLQQLQMMGIDINVNKNSNFTPISEMIKSEQ